MRKIKCIIGFYEPNYYLYGKTIYFENYMWILLNLERRKRTISGN